MQLNPQNSPNPDESGSGSPEATMDDVVFSSAGEGHKPQEAIQFYPTFGFFDLKSKRWNLQIAGRVIRPRPDTVRRRLLLRVIKQVLNASTHDLNSPIFQDRIRGFLMTTKRGRRVRVGVGHYHFRLKKRSNGSGEFRGTIRLTEEELRSVDSSVATNRWVSFRSRATKKIKASHLGRLQVIGPVGCSVISDIDDTIKTSNVIDRAELLNNTFFEPFEAVDGMPELFERWQKSGAAFHYVSSSPCQLYAPLATFMNSVGFPAGSFHLRSIRLRDPSILQLVVGRKRSKKRAIKQIVRAFPDRKFILVGDVGEKDPEIYGAAARKYPDQIELICLRRLEGSRIDPGRFARAFRKVPVEKWRVFDEAADLYSLTPTDKLGWLDDSV